MTVVDADGPARKETSSFGQMVRDACTSASTVITPLGFSIVTVGVLTPLGVVPVVTIQKMPTAPNGS